MFEEIKFIEENISGILDRNSRQDDLRKDFFKIKHLNDLEFSFLYKEPTRYNYPDKYGKEFFTLKCTFYKGEMSYQLNIKDLIIDNSSRWESPERYSFEVLKIIGYIAKSQVEKNGFYPIIAGVSKRYMTQKNEIFKKSLINFIQNSTKGQIDYNDLFNKPSCLVLKHISTDVTHQYRVGKDNKEYTTTEIWYTLEKENNDLQNTDSLIKIRKYLSLLKKTETSSDSYYAPLGESSHNKISQLDLGLSIAIKECDWENNSEIKIIQPNLSISKLKVLLFLLFCDFKHLIDFMQKFDLYDQFLLASNIEKFIKSNSYSIYDSTLELPWQLKKGFFNCIENELEKNFDVLFVSERLNYFIINTSRQTNNSIIHCLFEYFKK